MQLREDTLASTKTASRAEPRALVSDEDAPLLAALKAHRKALAEAAGMPPYIIFNDRSLIEMAQTRPATLDDFAHVNGVGASKLERYGQSFLAVINGQAPPQPHPARRKLAGGEAGNLYDRLLDVERRLERGECGTLRPLSLSAGQRAKLARARPEDLAGVARLIGDRATERFGLAFLEVIASGEG